jgi:hypothetical protein
MEQANWVDEKTSKVIREINLNINYASITLKVFSGYKT